MQKLPSILFKNILKMGYEYSIHSEKVPKTPKMLFLRVFQPFIGEIHQL